MKCRLLNPNRCWCWAGPFPSVLQWRAHHPGFQGRKVRLQEMGWFDQGHRTSEGQGLVWSHLVPEPVFSFYLTTLSSPRPNEGEQMEIMEGFHGRQMGGGEWKSVNGQSPRPRHRSPRKSSKDLASSLNKNSGSYFWHRDTKGCNSQYLLSKGPRWSWGRRSS